MFNCWTVFQWQADPYNNGNMIPCVVGAFDSPEKADAACLTEDHYVFPLVMNEAENGPPKRHAHAYYPRCKWRTDRTQADAKAEAEKK
jgi:hypothetical protein